MSETDNRLLLEKILCVLKLAHSKTIAKEKENILKNKTKRKIYNLCDRKHTVTDIAEELKTTQPRVSVQLRGEMTSGRRYYFKSLE